MSTYKLLVYIHYFGCVICTVTCKAEIVDNSGNSSDSDDAKARIEDLRNFMLDDNDLKDMRTDDEFLLRFLHATDFKMKNAQKMAREYYRYIKTNIDWIALDINDKIKASMDEHMCAMLPAVDRYGKKIFYIKAEKMNPEKLTLEEMNQLESIWYESVLDDPKVQEHGISLLIDGNAMPWQFLKWATPTNVRKYVEKLDNIPVKNSTIHIVQASKVIKMVLHLAWPFVTSTVKNKVKFHFDDLDSLFEYINPDNVPQDCGGSLKVDFNHLNTELLSRSPDIQKKLNHYKRIAF